MFWFLRRGKTTDTPRGGDGSKYWALATVAIVAVLVTAFLVLRGIDAAKDITETTVEKVAEGLKPKITIQTIISNAIGEIRRESKLVVMSVDLDVTIEKRSTKSIAWDMLSLGTTTVAFKARDNRVQYIVPTEALTPTTVMWDDETKTVNITIPPPALDESIVEVQSDPDKCEIRTEVGWARFRSRSGKQLEDGIRKELRPSVIEAGHHDLLMKEAERKAREVIMTLFMDFLKRDGVDEGVTIHIN